MKILISTAIESKKGLLIVPLSRENISRIPSSLPKIARDQIQFFKKNENLKGKESDLFSTYINNKSLPEKILLQGIGKEEKLTSTKVLELGGKIGKTARSAKKENLSVFVSAALENYISELIQGILMAQYKIDPYKSKKEKTVELRSLEIIVNKKSADLKNAIEKAQKICQALEFTKDLVNSPANKVDAEYLVSEAKKIAKANKYKLEILNEKELKKQKWGALLAVNQGSSREAKCIILHFYGAKNKKQQPTVLVGKGIIFDSGGYNLKPTNYIETMHQDMAGAATVLGVFSVLADLKIKKNIIAIIPIAENMISDRSFRPSDIITGLSGKTIEITNTDAEGRLILSDAITYGTKLKPNQLITIATLTGAVSVALGDRYSGLIGNNFKLRTELQKAGREVDDLAWPLPLHKDFKKKMDSEIADVRNTDIGSSRLAGSSKGAAFLEKFVGKTPWCHIDIGGTAFTSDPKAYETKCATGAGLRLLLNFLQK